MRGRWPLVLARIQRTEPATTDSPRATPTHSRVGRFQRKTCSGEKVAINELFSCARRLVAVTASEQRFQPECNRRRWIRTSLLSEPTTRLTRVSPLKTYLTG